MSLTTLRVGNLGKASCGCRPHFQGPREPLEVEDPPDQQRLLTYPGNTPSAETSQTVPVLGFPEELLDLLSCSLRELVSDATDPHADARVLWLSPARVGGDMGRDPALEKRADQVRAEEALVEGLS